MPDTPENFDHEDAKEFASEYPFRTMKHVADTLEKFEAEAAAVYLRAAKQELEAEVERLKGSMREALSALNNENPKETAGRLKYALDRAEDGEDE